MFFCFDDVLVVVLQCLFWCWQCCGCVQRLCFGSGGVLVVVAFSGVVMCHVVAVVLLLAVFQRWCLRNKKHTDSI